MLITLLAQGSAVSHENKLYVVDLRGVHFQ